MEKKKGKEKYRVEITCPDCTDIDYQGCFDGYPLVEYFDTYKEAEEYAEKIVDNSNWNYTINPKN